MKFLRNAFLVSGLIVMIWGAPVMAREPTRDLSLTYRVYYGGFEVLQLFVDIQMAPEKYAMELKFHTIGMIGSLFSWKLNAYARGRVTKDGVVPIAAGNHNSWQGKKRWMELRYAERRPTVADAHPIPKDDKPSPESLLNTIDLGSAIFAMTHNFDQNQSCDLGLPVFDGRRRYDLTFKGHGDGKIRRSRYSIYAGPVVNCRVKMNRLAGFENRQKAYGGLGEADRVALVSMGSPFANSLPVPVKIEFQTRWGDVLVHLTKASLTEDGILRKLARGPQ